MPGWKDLLEALLNDLLSRYLQNCPLLFPALFIPVFIHVPALSTAPFVTCSPLGDLAVFDIQKFLPQPVTLSPHSSVTSDPARAINSGPGEAQSPGNCLCSLPHLQLTFDERV